MNLQSEWCLLQNQFDSYEKYSLIIKLFSIAVLVTTLQLSSFTALLVIILLVLWLQDSIWKTFQGRIELRLLQIEKSLKESHSEDQSGVLPCQFNTEYLKQRPGVTGLIKEYCRQALRPTVAFPHFVLVLLALYNVVVN